MDNSTTIQWNGYLWVAELNGTRYADCNHRHLINRLYDAGASAVFEELTIPARRRTLWERLRNAIITILLRSN